uniref:Uncharacterized protein n=1 Tax=Glossina palpalis gambiensis TaxID=67801 RepID=A0A1B0BXL8_9MUSC
MFNIELLLREAYINDKSTDAVMGQQPFGEGKMSAYVFILLHSLLYLKSPLSTNYGGLGLQRSIYYIISSSMKITCNIVVCSLKTLLKQNSDEVFRQKELNRMRII